MTVPNPREWPSAIDLEIRILELLLEKRMFLPVEFIADKCAGGNVAAATKALIGMFARAKPLIRVAGGKLVMDRYRDGVRVSPADAPAEQRLAALRKGPSQKSPGAEPEKSKADQVHDILINRGPAGAGAMAKRASLSRPRVTKLLHQLEATGKARQEGEGRKRVWVAILVPESRCDTDDTARTSGGDSTPATVEPAPVKVSDTDAPRNDEPQREGAEGKGNPPRPDAPEATIAPAQPAGRSDDSLEADTDTDTDEGEPMRVQPKLPKLPRTGTKMRALFDYVQTNPGRTANDAAADVDGLSKSSASANLTQLKGRGLVTRGHKRPARWSVVEALELASGGIDGGFDWNKASLPAMRRHEERDTPPPLPLPPEPPPNPDALLEVVDFPDLEQPRGPFRPPLVSVERADPTAPIPPIVLEERPAPTACDGDHPLPDCDSPECWHHMRAAVEKTVTDTDGDTDTDTDTDDVAPVVALQPDGEPESEEDKHRAEVVKDQLEHLYKHRAHMTVERVKLDACIAALEGIR